MCTNLGASYESLTLQPERKEGTALKVQGILGKVGICLQVFSTKGTFVCVCVYRAQCRMVGF